jgi:type II secretory ATPase GspE/PulE/Tfp pilus assembly ATPase PilB-like protein
MFDYLNLVEWFVALATLVAWLRFSTFLAQDVTENLVDQPELPWKLGAAGVGILMLLIYLLMPSFWIALPFNVLIAGGMIGAFWYVRVKALGPAGHLFKGALQAAEKASSRIEERKNARQVQLSYLRHDNSPMPLPRPGDPLATGLGTADQIVIQALMRRAENVDLSPAQNGYALTLITDGVPSASPAIDRTSAEAAVQAFKVLAGLSADERRRPQSGTFRSRDADGSTTTWTVRTSGSTAGERVMLVANEKGQWDIPLEQLGFNAEQLNQAKKLTTSTKGLVIVAGPRGSGRTTTLYAMLKQHDAFTNSVQTLETNPQTEIEGATINRFENKPDASYSKSLQSIILKDPNVLLASQIPDAQTAELIARYAGGSEPHRVYTSLSAMDTLNALEVWLAMNPNRGEAVEALEAIIAQRLVRILCPTCKIPYQPDEATMKRLNLPVNRNLQSCKANIEPIVDRRGHKIICPDCGGIGFKGRTGIFEVLVLNEELKRAIASGTSMSQVKSLARRANLMLLVEHGIRKFATGVTAINEVTRVISAEKPGTAAGKTGVMPSQK